MNFFKRKFLDDLLAEYEGKHISLYMPFERESDKWDVNRIRLKNLLTAIEPIWDDAVTPFPAQALRRLVPDGTDLMAGETAVDRPGQGLAIFWAPNFSAAYYLPFGPEEQAIVGHRFVLCPLMQLLQETGEFHLLTLSQQQAQLWRGDRYHLRALTVKGMPDSLEEELALEDPERQLQFHTATGTPGGGQSRPPMFFGHDADKEKKGAVRRYLNEVAEAVDNYLSEQTLPLLTAGVGYVRALYAEVSDYPYLLEAGINGNPDDKKSADLQMDAWQIARPVLAHKKEADRDQLAARQHTDQVVQTFAEIVSAATYGRVQALFVAPDSAAPAQTVWRQPGGKAATGPLNELPDATPADLLDEAIVQTLRHGGRIHMWDRPDSDANGETPVTAALLRF
ncbi:MAG: hypothetical protein KDE28_28660 [Anaerolineales bacterium]|nr:hypothetical protein [Anaerolineales bacterium]